MQKSWNCVFEFLWEPCVSYQAGIHKLQVRIANREDSDQTASLEAVAI